MKALNAYPLSLDLNTWEREVMLRMDVVCEHIQDIAQSGRRRIFFATNDISFFAMPNSHNSIQRRGTYGAVLP
jgi:hypothetical protein